MRYSFYINTSNTSSSVYLSYFWYRVSICSLYTQTQRTPTRTFYIILQEVTQKNQYLHRNRTQTSQ